MSKQVGCDVLIKVAKDETQSSFKVIGGQTGATLNRSAETIDFTDKTNKGYKEYMAGLKEWSLDCDGFVVISDEGIKILDEQFEARKPVFVEIVVAGRKYTGSGYLTDYPIEFPLDSAVSYSFTISGTSALVASNGGSGGSSGGGSGGGSGEGSGGSSGGSSGEGSGGGNIETIEAVNGTLNLRKGNFYTNIQNNTTINLPSATGYTEIRLWFKCDADLTIAFPNIAWQNKPESVGGYIYEYIFTYVIGDWVGGFVRYRVM